MNREQLDQARRERARTLALDPRRIILIARSYREAENFLIAHRLPVQHATVVCDARGVFNLRSYLSSAVRVFALGRWKEGFRPADLLELLYILDARALNLDRLEEW